MFQFLALTRAGCRRSLPRRLRHTATTLATMSAVALSSQVISTQATYADSSGPPNIVLIMADDMGYSDIGCYGGEIETPNLDALAKNGLRYTNFYSENMCWVSRAALLTGVYHKTSLYRSTIHPRCVALPEALRAGGYQTRMSGKWHLAGKGKTVFPVDRGFEHWYGILNGAASFFAPHSLCRDRENVEHEYRENDDYYITDAISDEAVRYVREADREKPLFLYVAYTAAHWPLHARDEDIAEYKGRYAGGWDEFRKTRLKRMKELGVVEPDTPLSERHPNVPAWEDAPHKAWHQRRMEVYAAQVTCMDRGIGRIVEALKESDRFENTLILFTIDNGGCHVEYAPDRKGSYLPETTRDGRPVIPGNLPEVMPGPENTYQSYGYGWANASNTPFRLFKKFDHEGGIHTPMIAHWPRGITRPGTLVKSTAHLIDVMPTVLEVTGTELPAVINGRPRIAMDGLSLAPSLRGEPQTDHRTLFFMHARGRAVRQGHWKLVREQKGAWELYNLEADPNERINLADQHPEKVAELKKLFAAWQAKQKRRATLKD